MICSTRWINSCTTPNCSTWPPKPWPSAALVLPISVALPTHQSVWSNGRATEIGRTSAALGQGLGGQVEQLGVVQEFIQRVEQIIGNGCGLLGEGKIEQGSLSFSSSNHYLMDIID